MTHPAPVDARLRDEAERWLAEDPDPDTRAELRAVLDAGDAAGLEARFARRLAFGTAGMRGPLGAGPGRMNRALVRRVSAGLARRLHAEPGASERGVVVGHDARHKSPEFAEDTVRVLAGAGLPAWRFAAPVPTPLLAFAVRALDAAAGVQITASHNPRDDNGYKLYWGDGAQILAPLDAEISAAAAAVGPLASVPLGAVAGPWVRPVPQEVRAAYLRAAVAACARPRHRRLTVVHTPLHGVAGGLLGELFAAAGFPPPRTVPEQAEPDPAFPTVACPNPELPGVLDLALATAVDVGADLVVANDPDGDRLAASVRAADGGYEPLSGDDLGCLLADYLLTHGGGGSERLVATTVVSSRLLARIAAAHGVGYAETLTGFKWLARAMADAERAGRRAVLAYEQALGVMVGTAVLDKDGISAALVLAEQAAMLKERGRTLLDARDDLARRFGLHATAERSVALDRAGGLAAAALERLRASPPTQVGGVAVTACADHASGARRHADGRVERLATPPTQLFGLTLADGSRLQVRPSGTEPLLKFYLEVIEPVDGEVSASRRRAAGRLDCLAEAFVRAAAPGAG